MGKSGDLPYIALGFTMRNCHPIVYFGRNYAAVIPAFAGMTGEQGRSGDQVRWVAGIKANQRDRHVTGS